MKYLSLIEQVSKFATVKTHIMKSLLTDEDFNAIELLEKDDEFGTFIKRGQWYNSNKRDSLGITRNSNGKWQVNWVSQGVRGDIIDLLMFFYNINYVEALYLCYFHYMFDKIKLEAKRENKEEVKMAEKKFNNFFEEFDNIVFKEYRQQHISYIEKRNVKGPLFDRLIKENKISFDHNNIYFNWQDDNGYIVGSQIEGIYEEKRFKKIISGSLTNVSFNFNLKQSGNIECIILTEGVWDALSFGILYQKFLNRFENVKIVSMNGLKKSIIEDYIEKYPNAEIVLAIDNDKAADKFFEKIKEKHTLKRSEIKQEGIKDFNELLQTKNNNNYTITNKNIDFQNLIKKSYKEFKKNKEQMLNGMIMFYKGILNEYNLKLTELQKALLKEEIKAIEKALKENDLKVLNVLLNNLKTIKEEITEL